MSILPYKNPISPLQVIGSQTVSRTDTFGTNFSVLGTGGYMEVYNLSDLEYTIPVGQTGTIEFSGNVIPIQFKKGTGTIFSPDVLTLNSDNISSGRRRLGMLVYVYETGKIYQHTIDDYDNLWNNAATSSGPGGPAVVISDFGTTVRNNTADGRQFINAWTASTIEGVSGYTNLNATWRILKTGVDVVGIYLPLSGGTLTGGTIFQSGVTANTLTVTGVTKTNELSATTSTLLNLTSSTISASTSTFIDLSASTVSASTSTIVNLTSSTISASTSTFIDLSASTISASTSTFIGLSASTISASTSTFIGLTANTISASTYDNLPNTLYTGNGSLNGDRIVDISGFSINFSSSTSPDNLVLSGGNVGINVNNPSNPFHLSGTTNPIRVEGLTADTTDLSFLSIDNSGIIHTFSKSGITDFIITGFTYTPSANTFNLIQANGSGFSATINSVSGFTVNGDLIVTGITKTKELSATTSTLINLTATTISANTLTATTYYNLPFYVSASTPTGVTLVSGARWYDTLNGIELVYINDGDSSQWVQPASYPGPPGYSNLMVTSGITTSASTLNINTNYYGINYNGFVNLTLPNPSGYDGYNITIKDEGGYSSTYRIRLTPMYGTIDGNTYVDMNLNYMALHLVARNNNWWII